METDFDEAPQKTADIIDLTELLKRSLGGGKAPKTNTKKTTTTKISTESAPRSKSTTATTTKPSAAKSSPKISAKKAAGAKSPVPRKKVAHK